MKRKEDHKMGLNIQFQTLCDNIKLIRKVNDLSQKEMAKKLGIGVKTLSKLEKGIISPRLSTSLIFEISKCFDIPIQDLFSKLELRGPL